MSSLVGVGVVRGPGWVWGDQDGGEGFAGTIIATSDSDKKLFGPRTVTVHWDTGMKACYQSNPEGFCYSLRVSKFSFILKKTYFINAEYLILLIKKYRLSTMLLLECTTQTFLVKVICIGSPPVWRVLLVNRIKLACSLCKKTDGHFLIFDIQELELWLLFPERSLHHIFYSHLPIKYKLIETILVSTIGAFIDLHFKQGLECWCQHGISSFTDSGSFS